MKNIWSSLLLAGRTTRYFSATEHFIRKISDKLTAASYNENAVDYPLVFISLNYTTRTYILYT